MELNDKLEKLKNKLAKLDNVAIAYSGGVDSNFLLKVAKDVLDKKVVAITLNAMMHSKKEINEAKKYTNEFGVKHLVIDIDNLEVDEFIENKKDRCYHCKKYVFNTIKKIAKDNNIEYVLDGTNIDDLGDYRPGLKALEELNIISPLKECNLTKKDIRVLSKEMGLKTYNKPAFACLATRVPYNTRITKELLRRIEISEQYLADLGFNQFRVRVHENIARIEVGFDEIDKFFIKEVLKNTSNKFKEFGFEYVTLDMNGYEMGSMNKDISN